MTHLTPMLQRLLQFQRPAGTSAEPRQQARSGQLPRWQNWARTAACEPTSVRYPASETEVAQAVSGAARAGQRIKARGAGHSFTPIAVTEGVHLDLSLLTGVVDADPAAGLVTLLAGTRLSDLPRLLAPFGLGLENMGDIDAQTISGAIATGTHGTGGRFVGIAGQVRHLRMVLEDGRLVDAAPGEALFEAARIGLGALGVITAVTLQCVPAFALQAVEVAEPLADVLDTFVDRVRAADHFEFYWFPLTAIALTKTNTRCPVDTPLSPIPGWQKYLQDELVNNVVFELTCRTGVAVPALVPALNSMAAQLLSRRSYSDLAPSVFTSPRRVRFREMEYAIPLESLPAVLTEVDALIRRRGWRVSFPIEVRAAAADDVWLSTAYGRESAYVAVHRYIAEPFAEYFLGVEQIMLAAGGRPHWGKLHSLAADRLRPLYPRFDDFVAVRDAVAPSGMFGNDYLTRVLGR